MLKKVTIFKSQQPNKDQITKSEEKAPKSKLQAPNKSQISNFLICGLTSRRFRSHR
jgi:hypothetical protein